MNTKTKEKAYRNAIDFLESRMTAYITMEENCFVVSHCTSPRDTDLRVPYHWEEKKFFWE